MSKLFSRRRGSSASRPSQNPPLDRSTQSSAAAAASQAFMARSASMSSLSSAAAAAALRSHTTSPEPVGHLQTRGMTRRGSISSIGSGSVMGGPSRPGLERRGSQGSMTERTFRSPSPGRASVNGNGALSSATNAPPVPVIPKSLLTQRQRSSSLETQKRVTSPTPQGRGSGRAMSMDRSSMPPPPSHRYSKRLSDVHEEVERTDNNRNVNFSRPMSSQPASPTSPNMSPIAERHYTHGTGSWYSEPVGSTNTSRKSARERALDDKIARIQAAAGNPVKTSHSASSAQGSHLTRANNQLGVASDAVAPSYETADAIMVYDPNSRTFITKPRAKPKEPELATTTIVSAKPLAAGTYNPDTRRLVPVQEAKGPAARKPDGLSVDTDMLPPPRNPARLSPVNSPSAARLHKQPSVVREEPEEESGTIETGSIRQTLSTPAKSYASPSSTKQRSSSLDIPPGTLDTLARGRLTPSPSRSARFSASPVIQATRHEPPPRDLSPVKSALKHSPASSIRTGSPLAHFSAVPRSPTADMSDTASQASEDAFSGRIKKSVRVSFDEHAREIEPTGAASSPKAIVRERSAIIDDLDDDEDLMKPRPALPSFGSVRRQRTEHMVAEKVTEMPPERHETSSDHAVGGILKRASEAKSTSPTSPPQTISKDSTDEHSDDSEDVGQPLATSTPAQVKVADGVHSDDKQEGHEIEKSDTILEPGGTEDEEVPAINLLPPTPASEELRTLSIESSPKTKASFEIKVPGEWGKGEKQVTGASTAEDASAAVSPLGGNNPETDTTDQPVPEQGSDHQLPLMSAINETRDSDESAEFSDAAEDLSEVDTGGFASLDAIANSPVVATSLQAQASTMTSSPPPSPSLQQASKKAEGGHTRTGSSDWSEATAYWSRLSKQQREQIEREHLSSDDEGKPPVVKKTKKKRAPRAVESSVSGAAVDPPQPAAPVPRAALPAQPAPKKTLPAQNMPTATGGEMHMRKSMRGGPSGPVPPTPAESKGSLQTRSMRPLSAVTPQAQGSDAPPTQRALQTRAQPAPKPQQAPVMTSRMQKQPSNDSDSESSFKKKPRAGKANAQGQYNMKRSMRGGPVEQSIPAPTREERPASPNPGRSRGRDNFSIRSLSPTGSLFGRRKRVEDVRQSIRGESADRGARMTLRNGPPQKSSGGAVNGSKPRKFKSRFHDSDDEGEDQQPRRGLFKSRFTDSDDEDDDVFIPADLSPVRGIPRVQGQDDGDSTDLEDEDEDEDEDAMRSSRMRVKQPIPSVPESADIDRAMEAARKKLGIPAPSAHDSLQGASLQRGSLREERPQTSQDKQEDSAAAPGQGNSTPDKKKRGFMGSILRRNRNSTASVATMSTVGVHGAVEVPASPGVVTNPTAAPDASADPFSPAGKLARRASALQGPRLRRGDSTYSTATAPAAVGDSDTNGADWPLPSPVPKIPERFESGSDRPNTSDGADKVRFQDVDGAGVKRDAVYSRRTGKKKKFGMLRRAFGLND